MIAIDWSKIRSLNGSRAEGFEELCVQLARLESPVGACFKRKGTPDAGVECYSVVNREAEWGWQAKYFDGFGDSQWRQLDKSVKTALDKHPRLVRYFVCTPLDRPDARISGKKSAMERWDDHVAKWSGWASDRGMAVEFVYLGSSELIERLSRPCNIGRVRFWFDTRGFDQEWFTARLDEALKTAGPRYTPEIHVDLPIAAELEAFGRTEGFFDRIKAHARDIRKRLRELGYAESKVVEPSLGELAVAVSTKVEAVLNSLGALTVQPAGRLPFPEITAQVKDAESTLLSCERDLEAKRAKSKKDEGLSPDSDKPFRERLQRLYALATELREVSDLLIHAQDIAGSALMLLNGNAGTGKTHLLCDVAKQRIAAGRPTVLLMGQQFISQEPPWFQAAQQLDLRAFTMEEFVGALEAAAQAANCRALVLVDAINEGAGRLIWPSYLPAFLAHFERSPWIGVLLSVRSSYEDVVVPETIRESAASLTHHGFAEHEYDATRAFFIHYGLDLPSTPLIAPEFHNPLFLKTLCQGLNAKGERRLPRGFHGITATFDLYLSAINQRLSSTLDFNPKYTLVRQALEDFAKEMVDTDRRWLSLPKAEEVINNRLPGRDFERSLYRGLVVEGVLVEESVWQKETVWEDVVFISYERFADHVVANTLLDNHLDLETPALSFKAGGSLAFLWNGNEGLYVSSGLLEAMCIQIPERTGYELISLAPQLMENFWCGGPQARWWCKIFCVKF